MTTEDWIGSAIRAASPANAEITIYPATIGAKKRPLIQIVAEVLADNPDDFDTAGLLKAIHGRLSEGSIVGSLGDQDFSLSLNVDRKRSAFLSDA